MSQFYWVFVTLISHYRRHWGQSLFMAIGLVTGVGLWASVQIINEHARESYKDADHLLGAEAKFWIRNTGGTGIAVEDYINLRRAGFTEVYPIIEAVVVTSNGKLLNILASDLLALPLPGQQQETKTKPSFTDGLFSGSQWLPLIQPEYQAWYSAGLAKRLDIKPGDQVKLASGELMPAAIIQSHEQQGSRVFMDIGAAFSILSENRLSYLAVSHLDDEQKQKLKLSLRATSLTLIENQQALDLSQLTESLHTHLTAMGLLSFAVGMFIVFNAVRFSLLVREGTFNTLRELGVSMPVLSSAIVLETLLWSFVGGFAGIYVGYILSGILLPSVAGSLQTLFGAVVAENISLSPTQVLTAWSLTLLGLVLALTAPLITKARMSIVESRSPSRRWSEDARARLWLALGALLSCLLGGYLFPLITSVTDGFVVLTLILFSGALALPMILHLIILIGLRWVPDSHWKFRWAVSDSLAQLPQLRIALMALLLTLTANIGVTTLVDSFRLALSDWLEIRLSANIYVQSDSLNVQKFLLQAEHAPWYIDSHERYVVSGRWHNRPVRIQGLDTKAPDARDMLLVSQTDDGFNQWKQGSGSVPAILANEQVKYLAHKDVGDEISLTTPQGQQRFRIVGFFHDYGTPYYRFYLPVKTLFEFWPNTTSQGLALWTGEHEQAQAEKALMDAGAEAGSWISQAQIKNVSLQIFNRTFAITAALNGLTLVVAGIALLAALLAIHQQRLPEYAHWRSIGVTFLEWFQIVAIPLIVMVVITFLMALPLGWILSWMLIHKLNVIAFGWTMPLLWSWTPVLQLGLATTLVVALSLCFATVRVSRTLPTAIRRLGAE